MSYEHQDEPISEAVLKKLPPDEQAQVMETWFREHYEDPVKHTPYESAEGGYQWISGPYDAEEELKTEFEDVVPEAVIEELARKLEEKCPQWAGAIDDDLGLFDAVTGNSETLSTLREAADTIRVLGEAQVGEIEKPHLLKLLFANAVGAFETFLCDTFVNRIMERPNELRRFVESTPEFKTRKISYASVLKEAENIKETARGYLLGMVWHRLKAVDKLYQRSLLVHVDDLPTSLTKAVHTRHDIVHRNGKDKEGNHVVVSAADVEDVLQKAHKIAVEIDHKLREIHDCELGVDEV